jgi:thiol-disulfide isomerase/thioredoxin
MLFDPEATMELGVLDTGVLPFLSMFVNPKDAKGIMDGITAGRIGAEYLGEAEIKGKPCEKIRLTLGADALGGIMGPMMPMGGGLQTTMDLWVGRDAAGEPVLRRLSPDLDSLMKAMQEMEEAEAMFDMGEMKMTMVIDLERWTVDQPVDAKMFTFVKPEGASEVDDMMAAIQDMAGGMGGMEDEGMGAEAEGPEKKLLGKAAPDFALEQLGGGTVTNETLKGKIVVLDFWATWCGPCVRAMPILEKVTKSFKGKDVVFFAINLQESADQVRGFLTKKGWGIDVLMDKDGKVANKYFVGGIPQTVILGKDGSVQAVHVGMAPGLEKRLTEELELLISHGHLIHNH